MTWVILVCHHDKTIFSVMLASLKKLRNNPISCFRICGWHINCGWKEKILMGPSPKIIKLSKECENSEITLCLWPRLSNFLMWTILNFYWILLQASFCFMLCFATRHVGILVPTRAGNCGLPESPQSSNCSIISLSLIYNTLFYIYVHTYTLHFPKPFESLAP